MSGDAAATTPAWLTLALFALLCLYLNPDVLSILSFHTTWPTLAGLVVVLVVDAVCYRVRRWWQGRERRPARERRPLAVPALPGGLSRARA